LGRKNRKLLEVDPKGGPRKPEGRVDEGLLATHPNLGKRSWGEGSDGCFYLFKSSFEILPEKETRKRRAHYPCANCQSEEKIADEDSRAAARGIGSDPDHSEDVIPEGISRFWIEEV